MIFAHAFVGLIIAYIINLTIKKEDKIGVIFGQSKELLLWVTAILFSISPDLDLLYIYFIDETAKHRHLLTHSLVPYTVVFLIIIIYLFYKKTNNFYKYIALTAYLGISFHLFADLYTDPVYLLAPFIDKSFSLQLFLINKSEGLRAYVLSPYLATEIIIMITGTILLFKNFIKRQKELIILLALLGIIEASAIMALLPFIYSFN